VSDALGRQYQYMDEHGYVRTRDGRFYRAEEIRAEVVGVLEAALAALRLAQECSLSKPGRVAGLGDDVRLLLPDLDRLLKRAKARLG
jgi:hypothetical protein